MPGLPTLYKRGSLVPQMGEKKIDIDNYVPIEYIMNWFNRRIPKQFGNTTEIPITSNSDKVVILKSGTGSGKSTSIAPTLFREFSKRFNKNQIIITQPTQLTTQSITLDINNINAFKNTTNNKPEISLYKNLGYQYKEHIYKPLEKGILVCTTGILLQILKNNNDEYICNKYNVIIIDEVHNRTLDVDLILYFLFKIVNKNLQKCPFIILMSATMDVNKYANYFDTKTIFQVNGLTFPIEENFLPVDCVDYISKTTEIVDKIHNENIKEIDIHNNIDIIIFVHNKSILNKIHKEIDKLNSTYKKNYLLPITLTGDIFRKGDINYSYIFTNLNLIKINVNKKNVSPVRRVIIGTNVAETGITIDTLKYCIDIGYNNTVEYTPIYNCNLLMVKPITQASALQRKGRIGRKFQGNWYPIYTKNTFDNLQINTLPNVFTEDISFNLLNVLIRLSNMYLDDENNFTVGGESIVENIEDYGNLNIHNINLLDSIPYDMAMSSLKKLFTLGYISSNMYPTKIGLLANKFQKIKLEHIKIITSGYNYGANIEDLIIIISYLIVSKNNIVESNFKSFNIQFDEIDDECIDSYNYNKLKSRLLISCEFIDFLLFFKKFEIMLVKFKNIKKIENWCLEHRVKYKSLLQLIRVKDDIIYDMIHKMNMNPYLNKSNLYMSLNDKKLFDENEFVNDIIKIKKCLYEGFKLNLAYYNIKTDRYHYKDIIIDTNSYLTKNLPILDTGSKFIQNKPNIILYDDIIMKYDTCYNKFIFSPVSCITVLDGYIDIDNELIIS